MEEMVMEMEMKENDRKNRVQQRNGVIPVLELGGDDVDIPSKTPPRTFKRDIFFAAFSILMHIVDALIDVNLAVRYLYSGKTQYFAWTTTFILIPSTINFFVSRRMQRQDDHESREDRTEDTKCANAMLRRNTYCAILVLFQLTPVIRYYKTLRYALKARKFEKMQDRNNQRKYYAKMVKEDQDVALLRVLECFIEAAPQQALQSTILLGDYHDRSNLEFVHQAISIASSLGSMGWAMASYNRSIRLAQRDKLDVGVAGTCLQLTWHFGVTVSRIASISVVASVWPLYTGVACLCHWMGATLWIAIDSGGTLEFCRNYNRAPHVPPAFEERIRSVLFALVIGAVHLFVYLNAVDDGSTLWKHAFFYVLCFLENIAACSLWNHASSTIVRNSWHARALAALCIVPFVAGIIATILYYAAFHPSRKRETIGGTPC